MSSDSKFYQKLVIKIGSNVLTNDKGLPDLPTLQSLVKQIAAIKKAGIQVIVVSSGAVAAGRSVYKSKNKLGPIAQKQLFAALGQVKLMEHYSNFFKQEDFLCAQVLVTKEDFRDRKHYLNMKNCLSTLLENQIVPIVNENDVISVTELMFTDNDELAGMVATMLNADALFILSNVDGVYDGDPALDTSGIIHVFEGNSRELNNFVVAKKSEFGRGGMITKCRNALKVAGLGIPVHIANGRTEDIIPSLAKRESVGTLFPATKNASNMKKWVATSDAYSKGKLIINEGAVKALFSTKATSLLAVGIVEIEGEFKKGDIVSICNENGEELGLGISSYSDAYAKTILGQKNQKPVVHYDFLYLFEMNQ